MKIRQVAKVLGVAASVLVAASVSAEIIDFEDVAVPAGSLGYTFLPTPYHGFTWSGGALGNSWVVSAESGNWFAGTEAHSGQNFAWSNGATDLSLTDGPFDMLSMWARMGPASGSAVAHGYNGATELFTQAINLTDQYQLINMNFIGITRWTLTNETNNVLIDDINVSVPEPATLALLAIGLTGLGFSRRRQ